jgi:hypothetical protein
VTRLVLEEQCRVKLILEFEHVLKDAIIWYLVRKESSIILSNNTKDIKKQKSMFSGL